ncbi:unnamed protein product [Pleuronectes platessa]|uniref:Uncharacterized protein n=1 Tax=Pleuronectes platessa TaxID=8262 RepID=A0A9N7V652_PLEPL|nr:unnamed protein product [Pleuronectes platessa]
METPCMENTLYLGNGPSRSVEAPDWEQQGGLHRSRISSLQPAVPPDVRHAGSQMSAFMSGALSFVATAHRDPPGAPLAKPGGLLELCAMDGYISSDRCCVSKWLNVSFVQYHIRRPRPTPSRVGEGSQLQTGRLSCEEITQVHYRHRHSATGIQGTHMLTPRQETAGPFDCSLKSREKQTLLRVVGHSLSQTLRQQ